MKKLPDLPRTTKRQEIKSSASFIDKYTPPMVGSYEMKDTRGKNYLPWSEVKDRQVAFGLTIQSKEGVWIRVQGLNGEPDYIFLKNTPSHIVVKYPRFYAIISINNFLHEKKNSKAAHLTAERAKNIAIMVL